LERFNKSSLYEFNQAVSGYWRKWERETAWLAREIIFAMIQGNANIKTEDKPNRKEDLWKLSIDTKEEVKKVQKVTEQDLKVFEKMQFNKI
jgi:hypothetical protein